SRTGLSPGASHAQVADVRRGDRPPLDALLVSAHVALRRSAGTGLPAKRRPRTRRTGRRGGRARAEETAPERPVAVERSSPQSDPLRHGSRGRQGQPVEHPPRSPSAGLVRGPSLAGRLPPYVTVSVLAIPPPSGGRA